MVCSSFIVWEFLVNCDLLNNNNSAFIKLGMCAVNVSCQLSVTYCIVKTMLMKPRLYRVFQNLCHKLFLGITHPHLSKQFPINMALKVNRFRDIHCCVEIQEVLWSTPVTNIVELWERILATFDVIRNRPGQLERLRESMMRRLNGCVAANDQHFETSYVILKRVPAHERKSISRNLFTFRPMLIRTFLLKWGWGIPRKNLWQRFWDTLYISQRQPFIMLERHVSTHF